MLIIENRLIDLCKVGVRYLSGYQSVIDIFYHCNQILFFLTDFHLSPKISSFMEIRPVGVAVIFADRRRGGRTDGQTAGWRDMIKAVGPFRNYTNTPNNVSKCKITNCGTFYAGFFF